MTPGEPGAPPPVEKEPPPPAPGPVGIPLAVVLSAGVPRYLLFAGPLVDERTKAADARRAMMFYRGWEAFVAAAHTVPEIFAWIENYIDESESWWQVVDAFERTLIFASYDPRPRH